MQVILFSCKDYLVWQGHGNKTAWPKSEHIAHTCT